MKKLKSFFNLKGESKEDNKLIQREKRNYIYARLLRLFSKGKPIGMGLGLEKPVIANSKGLFYCREKSLDLHIISDSYEFKAKQIFENLAKKSSIIVDVGANIGRYTILGGLVNPDAKIYAIEPDKDNFAVLSTNVKLNKLTNVECINSALGNEKGQIKLYGPSNTTNHGGYSVKIKTDNFEMVNLDTFDNLFGDKVIDLVKMDVEGFELDVIKGMTTLLSNHKVKNLILEIDDENYAKVASLFLQYGYSIHHIMYNNYLVTLEKK